MKVPTLAVTLVLAVAVTAGAQSEPIGELSESQVVERILDLQRQIDELIATLPPPARAELEKRMAERGSPPPVAPSPPEPAVQPVPAAPEPPVRRRLVRGPHCSFLDSLDSNGDGKISALDRYWRHLHLWNDTNGDRAVQEGEVVSAYERNVREIAVDLSSFIRKKGTHGEIRVGERLLLDVRGDGFGGADDAVLVVDATRLKRGTGPEVLSASGEPLDGFQPFEKGARLRGSDGEVTVFRCP